MKERLSELFSRKVLSPLGFFGGAPLGGEKEEVPENFQESNKESPKKTPDLPKRP